MCETCYMQMKQEIEEPQGGLVGLNNAGFYSGKNFIILTGMLRIRGRDGSN